MSGVEKLIINMVDRDHGIQDSVIRFFGPWDAESDAEHKAILDAWNPNARSHGGTLPSVDVEAKLKKLTAIDFDYCYWSSLLNPNKPPVLPSVQRVPTSGKSQLASEPEETVREETSSISETGGAYPRSGPTRMNLKKPRVPGGRLPARRKWV